MIETTGHVVTMDRNELIKIIDMAATRAVQEALKHFPAPISGLRPSSVNQTEAAEMLNLSYPTIRKMVRHGTFRLNKLGKIPIEQIDQALKTDPK